MCPLPSSRAIALATLAAALGSVTLAGAAAPAGPPQQDDRLAAAEPASQTVTVTGQVPTAPGYRATATTTFTKTDTPLKEIPASVTIVPAPLMKDQAMQSLADVIRYVPGALAHQGEGNRDEFILRGIGSSANLYVDGIRDDAQVFRDLYNLERVEVLKGAAGMIFGRGAGGVLNRVTKKPVFGRIAEASLTFGQYDQLRGTLDLGNAVDSMAWRISAMAETSRSFRDGVTLDRHAINPTLTIRPDARTALTLGVDSLRDERTADRGVPSQGGLPLAGDPRVFFGNAGQSAAHSYVDGAYALLDHDFGRVQLKNTLRVTRYDKYYQNVFAATGVPVSAAGEATLAAYNNANQRTNVFNQTDLTTRLGAGGVEHTLLAGVEVGHQDSTNKRNTGFFGAAATSTGTTVPVDNPVAVATAFRPNGTDADNNVRADIAAVYLQDQAKLSAQWSLLAGVRYDVFRARLDDRRTTLTAVTTPSAPVDLARTDKAFSPRVGVIWSPTAVSSYYASISRSFLPSAETLGLTVLSNATGLSTADLEPETARNVEIGGRWDASPGLALSAALFRLDRDHVRNADGNGGVVQTGQQRTQGLELGAQGDVTRDWQIYAGYAHLDARITQATTAAATLGHRPPLVAQDTLSVWNRWRLSRGFGAGLGAVYQSASYPNVDNAVVLPAFTRWDGALYYELADGRTRVGLNVENLLDRRYFATADANNNISPGAPRNARLTVTTAF